MRAITEPIVHPANNVARNACEKLVSCRLVCVHIILQQFGVVIAHLFEMRDDPAFIDGVAMKSACQLIVDAASGHFLERVDEDGAQFLVSGTNILVHDEIESGRMRKLGCASESAIGAVKHLPRRFDDGVNHGSR